MPTYLAAFHLKSELGFIHFFRNVIAITETFI